MPGSYTVRPFRPGDRAGYLALYREVFDAQAAPAWFRWKYEANPYADEVPIYLAETDGELVGARSFFAMPLGVGDDETLAFQPCDTMVAEDHRRLGLFTEMTEAAVEAYRDGDPELCFNFPNDRTLPGNLDLGWRTVRTQPIYYRLQRPTAITGAALDGPLGSLADRVASTAATAYHRVQHARAEPDEPPVTVDRSRGVPTAILTDLYRAVVPDSLHTYRDEQFLDWRFDNPRWDYATYLARDAGSVVGATVVGRRDRYGFDRANVVDVLPLSEPRPGVYRALLAAVVDGCRDADLLTAFPGPLPSSLLAAFGFVSDATAPLSLATETTTLVARPLSADGWTVRGRAIDAPANWSITAVAQDTS